MVQACCEKRWLGKASWCVFFHWCSTCLIFQISYFSPTSFDANFDGFQALEHPHLNLLYQPGFLRALLQQPTPRHLSFLLIDPTDLTEFVACILPMMKTSQKLRINRWVSSPHLDRNLPANNGRFSSLRRFLDLPEHLHVL